MSLKTCLFAALFSTCKQCSCQNDLPPHERIERRVYDLDEIELDPQRHHSQFFNFVTRPDIDAPKWNIEFYDDEALAPGCWFVTPYTIAEQKNHDDAYVGPYIYDNAGELIWSGTSIFNGYAVFDFKVSKIGQRNMLSMIYLHGNSSVIINNQYQNYRTIETGRDTESTTMHDFQIIDGTRSLFLTRDQRRTSIKNSLRVGFEGRCYVQFTGFKERDVSSGELLFRWSPEGHISLDESMIAGPTGNECESEPWDYCHANSIEKLPDGDYLLSSHRTYAVYKISHKDSSVIWRLGGKKSDFEWIGNGQFGGQHDARCHQQNKTHMIVSVLDNANGPGEPRTTNDHSRGLLILLRLDSDPMTAQIMKHYDHPWRSYAPARGNFQILPNGNAFIGWSTKALQSEHSPDGTVLMEASLRPGLKTYRSYKFQWIGLPKAPPDIHSIKVESSNATITIAHVSWNGATEVQSWHLYGSDPSGGSAKLIAASLRQGFETPLAYRGFAEYVFAEAIARNKTSLGRSSVVATITKAEYFHPAILEQIHRLQYDGKDNFSGNATLTINIGKPTETLLSRRQALRVLCGFLSCIMTGIMLWAGVPYFCRCLRRCPTNYCKYSAIPVNEHD